MNANFLRQKHQAGLSYDAYVRSGTEAQYENWRAIYQQISLTDEHHRLVGLA